MTRIKNLCCNLHFLTINIYLPYRVMLPRLVLAESRLHTLPPDGIQKNYVCRSFKKYQLWRRTGHLNRITEAPCATIFHSEIHLRPKS